MIVINNDVCVSDYLPEGYVGTVWVYAVAVEGPDEGPYLLDTLVESREKALELLRGVNPGPYPQAIAGMAVPTASVLNRLSK